MYLSFIFLLTPIDPLSSDNGIFHDYWLQKTNCNLNTRSEDDDTRDDVDNEEQEEEIALPELPYSTGVIAIDRHIYLIKPVVTDFPGDLSVFAVYCESHAPAIHKGTCYHNRDDPGAGDNFSCSRFAVDLHG